MVHIQTTQIHHTYFSLFVIGYLTSHIAFPRKKQYAIMAIISVKHNEKKLGGNSWTRSFVNSIENQSFWWEQKQVLWQTSTFLLPRQLFSSPGFWTRLSGNFLVTVKGPQTLVYANGHLMMTCWPKAVIFRCAPYWFGDRIWH